MEIKLNDKEVETLINLTKEILVKQNIKLEEKITPN